MFLQPPNANEATERFYKAGATSQGFVMNLLVAWAWRPDISEAFTALRTQLTATSALSKRDQAVLVCATAAKLKDSYCSLAWGKSLAAETGAEAAAALLSGGEHSALTARDRALAAWATKVVADPNSTTSDDVEALRYAGLDDRTIFDVTAFIAFRLAFSTVNDALGAQPDWELVRSVPHEVRDAVTYGRAPEPPPRSDNFAGGTALGFARVM